MPGATWIARMGARCSLSLLLLVVEAQGATLPVQLDKLNISHSVIPADCAPINVKDSLCSEFRLTVLATTTVLVLQGITIAALLWERRRRHLAEDAAAIRADELARAARIASAGELSASIAHEVGQPLGAILNNADAAGFILNEDPPDLGELAQILTDVRRDALRANQVVRRLRALLQRHTVEFTPLSLNSTVEESVALLASEARRRQVSIEADLRHDGGSIIGDRIQLQQVVLNLAVNAMDAMEDTEPAQRVLTISTRRADDGIELRVTDRGHGIPEETKQRLFDSFYTTKPRGMGLGLSIVRTIVESHGGHITARRRANGGSEFLIWLPPMSASDPHSAAPDDRPDTRMTRIDGLGHR